MEEWIGSERQMDKEIGRPRKNESKKKERKKTKRRR